MSVSRSDAASLLNTLYTNLAQEVGYTTADDAATGYGPDIDNALRRMGEAESALASATVDDEDRDAFFTLCQYFALQRFASRLATRADIGAPTIEPGRRTVFENVLALLRMAAAQAAAYGYPVDAGDAWSLVGFQVDFTEPPIT